jgi:hypothetical protein
MQPSVKLAAEQFPSYSSKMPLFEIRRRSIFVVLLVSACGGDGGDGGMSDGAAGSTGAAGMAGSTSANAGGGDAAVICREGIACGYQLADQASCEDLFELFFDVAELAACRACVDAEACATELDTCQGVCTLQ